MSDRVAKLAQQVLQGASYQIADLGLNVQQVIIIVKAADSQDPDDTALATLGTPEEVKPEAVLNTLLSHVKLAGAEVGVGVAVFDDGA